MRRKWTFVLLLVVGVVAPMAAVAVTQRWNITEVQEPLRRTLKFSSGAGDKTLAVDSIRGSIEVLGFDGDSVEMIARKTIHADSDASLHAATEEVKLDITEGADIVSIFVDEPGRQPSDFRIWQDRGYAVDFDFELRVPRNTSLRLRTVVGDIDIKDVDGDFNVESTVGNLDLNRISGSGRIRTVSGMVTAVFARNPLKDSYFGSTNGDVDVTFPRNLSADIRFKTFNGGVYTDFPIGAVPVRTGSSEVITGRILTRNSFSRARIGTGGPTLQFDGFNGNVRIRQAK